MVSANGYYYTGKSFPSTELATQIAEAIPTVQKLVIFDLIDDAPAISKGIVQLWDDFIAPYQETELFLNSRIHPSLYIMFSSGTTGLPKCIVHSQGGVMLNHKKNYCFMVMWVKGQDVLFHHLWLDDVELVNLIIDVEQPLLFDGSPFIQRQIGSQNYLPKNL